MRSSFICFLVLMLVAAPIMASSLTGHGDVSIYFNGGGSHNKVYVGATNIMEIWIRNDSPLKEMHFDIAFANSGGSFSWKRPYGNIPKTAGNAVIQEHGDALNAFQDLGGLQVVTAILPNEITVAGAAINSTLPAHDTSTLFYTMALIIPAGQADLPGGFSITWECWPPISCEGDFNDGSNYEPTFQGRDWSMYPTVSFDLVNHCFHRGDSNGDCTVNISDAVFDLSYIFAGGEQPWLLDAADMTNDGKLNISDAVAIIGFIFGIGGGR